MTSYYLLFQERVGSDVIDTAVIESLLTDESIGQIKRRLEEGN